MTTTHEVIRAAIPGATDAVCNHILWERTPYPMGAINARMLFKAASGLQRASKNGRSLCDLCSRESHDGYTCLNCMRMMSGAAQ